MNIQRILLLVFACGSLFSSGFAQQSPLSLRLRQQLSPQVPAASAVRPASPAAATGQKTLFVEIDTGLTTWETLRGQGFRPVPFTESMATVRLTLAEAGRLARQPGVVRVEDSATPRPMVDVARSETGVQRVIGGEGLAQPFTGEGVVVGIVDAGFDYLHSAFRRPDGTLRISRVWEQGSTAFEGYAAPEKFGYGIELPTPAAISAAGADREGNSHGTHVAALAAGSDGWGNSRYCGAAPDAEIVLVALDLEHSTTADIANGVAYVYDYAESVGKPCVVNLSLGNHEGPHDGTSAFDRFVDGLLAPGRLLVGASGNHRADKFHIEHTFAGSDAAPLRTFADYKQAPSNNSVGGAVEIWGDEGVEFDVTLSAYSIFNHKDAESVTLTPGSATQQVGLGRYVTGSFTVSNEVDAVNGRRHWLLTSGVTGIRTNYAVAITVTPKSAGRVNLWADNVWLNLADRGEEGFTQPTTESTVAEIGGTGKRILSVGAYTTRNEYTTLTTQGSLDETLGDRCSFSSGGLTLDGRPKPEVCAPGCFILSAFSAYDGSQPAMVAEEHEGFGGHTDRYGYMQGTSMAAPFTAGIVATWLEAYPELTPEALREVVAETSRTDAFTENAEGWGSGKVDAFAGVLKVLQLKGSDGIAFPTFAPTPRLSLEGRTLKVAAVASGAARLQVFAADGRQVVDQSLPSMSAGEVYGVGLPALSHGVWLFRVTVGGVPALLRVVL